MATTRTVAESDTQPSEPVDAADVVDLDPRDAEIEELRRQLADERDRNVILANRPTSADDAPEGYATVLPKGDFDIYYGGRRYYFKGGERTQVPAEIAGYLKGQVLVDPSSGTAVPFLGDCLFR